MCISSSFDRNMDEKAGHINNIVSMLCNEIGKRRHYRDNFIGEFIFTTFSIMREYDYQLDTIYVTYDIIKFCGSLIKNENEKLTITLQSQETERELDSADFKPLTLGKIYPTVDLNGTFSYPEFVEYGGSRVSSNGMFNSSDSIDFSYGYEVHLYTYYHNVFGIKTTQYE